MMESCWEIRPASPLSPRTKTVSLNLFQSLQWWWMGGMCELFTYPLRHWGLIFCCIKHIVKIRQILGEHTEIQEHTNEPFCFLFLSAGKKNTWQRTTIQSISVNCAFVSNKHKVWTETMTYLIFIYLGWRAALENIQNQQLCHFSYLIRPRHSTYVSFVNP